MSDPTHLTQVGGGGPVVADAETEAVLPTIPGQPGAAVPTSPVLDRPRSLWSDAWRELRRKPLFIVSMVLILIFVVMAIFPTVFTSVDPKHQDLTRNLNKPIWGNWFQFGKDGQFGYDIQGRDVYARTIYGARASIVVGVSVVLGNLLIGGLAGIFAGYTGRWVDSLLSRIGDIFLGLPFVLGALVILSTFAPPSETEPSPIRIISLVVTALVVLGWPSFARIMRSSVISTKQLDYVQAARALGAGPRRIVFRHVLPNAMAPLIVVATISIGAYIGAEATLSFLGVGLREPVVSWGVMVSAGIDYREIAPHMMLFPGVFLTMAVLSFVMLGDAVRDALDPKLR
jgi:oligopeptide transport system permease protein